MADSQRKTANLFDKNNTTIYDAYLSTDSESSIWIPSATGRSIKIPCEPNTQYTLSISSTIPIFRISASSNANIEPLYSGVRVRIITRSANIQQYTFTTSADDACLIFQGSSSLVNEWFNSLMLNTGSTPLPYEPYGWLHSLRMLTTATDIITSLPTNIYADGTNATVSLKGNMSQSGTPTPDNPIQPQECGERTENLFDYSTITTGYRIVWGTGALFADDTGILSDFIEVTEGQRYQISSSANSLTAYILGYDQNKEYLGVYNSVDGFIKASSNRYSTLVIPENLECRYIKLMTYGTSLNGLDNTSMFTAGATAPSKFIPYGYKIPISSANTTTPVYLGEVQTTRQIKKVVLDGTEDWGEASGTNPPFRLNISGYARIENVTICVCSHYAAIKNVSTTTGMADGKITFLVSSSLNNYLYLKDTSKTTVTDFKSYLAAQYAAGTPVTVWYVLATEETGIVNEPLRKIGDYVDTVSGVTIPTITGADHFDVQTTLKPSEVSLSYTGWRDASVEEWDGTDWT